MDGAVEDGKERRANERRLLIEHRERGKETMTANFGAEGERGEQCRGRGDGRRRRAQLHKHTAERRRERLTKLPPPPLVFRVTVALTAGRAAGDIATRLLRRPEGERRY